MQIKTKIVSCHTADSKPVKQEVNCTVILPPLVFPAHSVRAWISCYPVSQKREREGRRRERVRGERERNREGERERKREGERE